MRWFFAVTLLALAVMQPAWHGWQSAWAWLFAGVLALPLDAVCRHSLRAAGASCFLALPFFVHGITESMVNPAARFWALLETGICTALFIALVLWTVSRRHAMQQPGHD
jgi:uncharacterized membrane protein